MRRVVRFKRYLSVEVIPGDAVYLFSERSGQTRVQGGLVERLAPLLDGQHSRGEVVSLLSDDFERPRIDRALDLLIDGGHVVEADPDIDVRASGYWESYQHDGDLTVDGLARRTVDVVSLGASDDEWFADAAASFGFGLSTERSDLTVVFVDDYLCSGLAERNRQCLSEERPWLLAKPVGSVIWVGPVFVPGRTACWECLADRLRGNDVLGTYLRQRGGSTATRDVAVADVVGTRRMGMQLTALRAAQWLADAGSDSVSENAAVQRSEQCEVLTWDTITMEMRKHPLQRRPECPTCGDAGLQARLHNRPVELVSRPKAVTGDGGHRAKSPNVLLSEYEPLISPITGVVKQLKRIAAVDDLYVYHAGQNFAIPMAGVSDLRAGLRNAAAGKGISDVQAKASAVAEAIERHSGVYRGDEAKITASLRELEEDAIAPNDLALYSERQFADRKVWNAKGSHFLRVCDPLDPAEQIDWTPVWSLTHQRHRHLPTASAFYGYQLRRGNVYAVADSNGNAAGTCLEDAVMQGFLELVERDSVAIWWYNMLSRPSIDLDSFDEPYFARWQQRYRSVRRKTWVLDLTTDLGIPSVVAVSHRVDKSAQDILMGFGAHFDIEIAISRAMTEMNQFLPAVINVVTDADDYAFADPYLQDWWRTATIDNQPYLSPLADKPRTAADYSDLSTDDLATDVRRAQQTVENAGMEMLVLDQTRPDIGLPVVKVIVPGMRHFWTRYAPGRLYDVPVRMGWRDAPTPEHDLNPIGMFL